MKIIWHRHILFNQEKHVSRFPKNLVATTFGLGVSDIARAASLFQHNIYLIKIFHISAYRFKHASLEKWGICAEMSAPNPPQYCKNTEM